MFDVYNYTTERTGDIVVSAYQELLEDDNTTNKTWAYCLRIENNSDERITLLKKNLCLTDEKGNCQYLPCLGFNGELPDLEPGECFEFEDTAQTNSAAAVLYGSCSAVTLKGKELKIKLPLITLSSQNSDLAKVIC